MNGRDREDEPAIGSRRFLSLDPCCAYLVFEKRASRQRLEEFDEIRGVLDELEHAVIYQELLHDSKRESLLLVIKLDPASGEWIKENLLSRRPPRDIAVSFYDRVEKP